MQRLMCRLTDLSIVFLMMAQFSEELMRDNGQSGRLMNFYTICCDLSRNIGELANRFVGGLRCLPCHECVKLNDELFDTDPVSRLVVEQIACAWLVTMNGVDLRLFQYDTEITCSPCSS